MSRWTPVFTLLVGIVIGVIIGSSSSSSSSYHRPRPRSPGKPHYIFIKAATLNVRAKPSTTSTIVRQLVWGDSAREINRRGEWVKIIVGFDTAWVHRDFVGSRKDFERAKKKDLAAKAKNKQAVDREKAQKQRMIEDLQRREKEKLQRELAYIERYKDWYLELDKECKARAEFRKTWLGWELYAAGQSKLISEIFPKDKNKIARVLEELGAGDPVHYVTYLRHIKVCK